MSIYHSHIMDNIDDLSIGQSAKDGQAIVPT